jgi:hypothetical protein
VRDEEKRQPTLSLPEINFENIRPYDGSRHTGFEELCSQLAALEPAPAGSTFYRKGRGADAGVECYLRAVDGSETGWQAKYLFVWDTSLAAQLDKSIRTALNKHPALSTYIVCFPFDLSDARPSKGESALQKWQAWKAHWEDVARAENRSFTIQLWSKSAISSRLSSDDARYAGRLLYWFGQEALTGQWFLEQFRKAQASLGSRYTPETNVELPIRNDFLALCRDPRLQVKIDKWFVDIKDKGLAAVRAVRDAAGKGIAEPYSEPLYTAIDAIGTLMDGEPIGPEHPYPLVPWCDALSKCLERARTALNWVYQLPPGSKGTTGATPEDWARHELFEFIETLNEIIDGLGSQHWRIANAKAVLLQGPAGIGKSHLLADVVQYQIHEGRPALIVLGSSLIDDEPWRQIMKQLDLPLTQQVKHFLGALDAAAQAVGTRVIVCVDALNERHGIDIWASRLAAFLAMAAPFPRICIALSCRSTYVSYVIPEGIDDGDLMRIEHEGFAANSGEAAKVYLDKRGIVRPGAPNLVPEFENPLFLKTCCDFLEKEGERELPRGLRGVTAIFGFYNTAVARALNARMRLDARFDIVPRAISGFANLLARAGEGYLPKVAAIDFFESVKSSAGRLDQSLLAQLESEGVLAVELVRQEDDSLGEIVRFSFERFSDHAIAARLLDEHLDAADPKRSFNPGTELHEYVFGETNYRRAGIIEAIAIQLPERTGVEVLDVTEPSSQAWTVQEAFLESLLWRDQSHFTDRTFELAKELRDDAWINNLLISIATEPTNKFNARFVHERLLKRNMTDRDKFWSIYLAEHGDDQGEVIETLILWTLQNGMGHVEDERAQLAALMLTWFFTTTHRPIRDKATKALACLLANRMPLASATLREFATVDDMYVLERLLAAVYGAVLQGTAPDGLEEIAETVFSIVFAGGSPPANALLRDHALGLLEYVEWRGKLRPLVDMNVARPPYKSPWPIETVPNELIESYKQDYGKGEFYTDAIVSSSVNDGDFARYVIDHVVDKWSPAPIGTRLVPQRAEVCKSWVEEFCATATQTQLDAFSRMLAAAEAAKGQHTYEKTPEQESLNGAIHAFQTTISPSAWEDFRVRAKQFIQYQMFADRTYDTSATFDVKWGRRWVCKRAHELGWTAELFASFDRGTGHDRHDHRIERIGKKYQWLALQELAARMADNLAFLGGYGDFENDEPRLYASVRQIGLRDIDPSLLVTQTHYDGWGQWGRTWWVPFHPQMRAIGPAERRTWLDSDRDVINDVSLIAVCNPRTGKQWLTLKGFANWRQWGVEDASKEFQRDTWFRLSCVVVRKGDKKKLIEGLKDKMLTDPHALPRIELHGDHYLGEYPWHPSVNGFGDWTGEHDWRKLPVQSRATVATYTCERGGYDYSVDKTVSVELPAPWLANAMGLRLSNGQKLTYVGESGEVLFYDPSVNEEGPQAALVDRDAFLLMLEREDLAAIWVIAGEKGIFGGRDSSMGFGGRILHTAIYWIEGDDFASQFYWEREDPSAEQLRIFFGENPIPSGITVREPRQQSALARRRGKSR